jgi:hypothetical protein
MLAVRAEACASSGTVLADAGIRRAPVAGSLAAPDDAPSAEEGCEKEALHACNSGYRFDIEGMKIQ